jgi:hypothetical protein
MTAFRARISAASRKNALVADMFFDLRAAENPLLVEVNPWRPPTDPCPFDWHEPFDASFRCIGPGGTLHVISMALHASRPAAWFCSITLNFRGKLALNAAISRLN